MHITSFIFVKVKVNVKVKVKVSVKVKVPVPVNVPVIISHHKSHKGTDAQSFVQIVRQSSP